MIFDILKGFVLVVFSAIILVVGTVMEVICVSASEALSKPRVIKFIYEIWIKAYKK